MNLIVWSFALKLVLQACYEYHLTWAWVPHIVREFQSVWRVVTLSVALCMPLQINVVILRISSIYQANTHWRWCGVGRLFRVFHWSARYTAPARHLQELQPSNSRCGWFSKILSCELIQYRGFPRFLESPGFFLENSRTWKVLENHFGSAKSWKLKLKVLESRGKISLKCMDFSSSSNGKQAAIVYHPVCVDCCLLKYSVECWWMFCNGLHSEYCK